ATIEPQRLQEAAASWSAMVSMLLYNLEMNWFKAEMGRHETVRAALERNDSENSIEQRLCQQVRKSFRAERVDLYLSNSNGELRCYASAARGNGEYTGASGDPDDFVKETARGRKKTINERRHQIQSDEWRDHEIARTEGRIERIGLQLRCDEQLIGVLDLHY